MKHACFVVLPGTHLLDLAGPLQIVSTLAELGIAKVETQCVGPAIEVRAFQRVLMGDIRPLPDALADDTAVFVIGSKLTDRLLASSSWRQTADWLRGQAGNGCTNRTICGVCTGAFLLGAAGLLDDRVCTTHYRFVDWLARAFPKASVVADRVYVRDRGVWTSAGVTAGIDMTLHLIASNFGDDAAIRVARENVAYFRSFAGDPPLGAPLRHRSHANVIVHAIQDRICSQPSKPPDYAQLVREIGYSARHLARLFERETGTTIKRYQMQMRLDLARRLLADSTFSIERIAHECGFRSVQAFRASWDKYESMRPSAVRAAAVEGRFR